MNNLDNLYKEIILEHYKHPRNKADLSHIHEDEMHSNPSCGDSVKIEVLFDESGRICKASHDGQGCAISTASASLLTENIFGKTKAEAITFIENFLAILRGESSPEVLEEFGDLAALGGVMQFPMRIKCATLAWHAADKALEKYQT